MLSDITTKHQTNMKQTAGQEQLAEETVVNGH